MSIFFSYQRQVDPRQKRAAVRPAQIRSQRRDPSLPSAMRSTQRAGGRVPHRPLRPLCRLFPKRTAREQRTELLRLFRRCLVPQQTLHTLHTLR